MTESGATGRSLAETPTWSVASVITVMVVGCLLVERSIYRLGKVRNLSSVEFSWIESGSSSFLITLLSFQWLEKTRRKALLASLEKIKEG